MYCYFEFKLRYLKNLKLFSISVNEIIEAYSFTEKRRRVFALFKSIFLKTDLWETLGDSAVKNVKLGRKICVLLKIDQVETKCSVRQIITIICVTYVQKNFKIRTLIRKLFTKYHFLTKLPQISHYSQSHNLPYEFHGSDIWGMYFFIFASCEPLTLFFL